MAECLLFDIPSTGRCACWTPNPWKIRIALNFKDVPYRTQWVEFPDVEETLKAQGVSPHQDTTRQRPFTVPTVRFDEDTVVMDSAKIAAELEKRHPTPSMHLGAEIIPVAEKAIKEATLPLLGVMMPRICRELLNERSTVYYEETRSKLVGMPLAQYEQEKGGEPAWLNAKPALESLASLLKQNGGPYFLGEPVSYADFMLVALIQGIRRIDEKLFERFVNHDEAFTRLYKACERWVQRDT